MKHSDNDMTLVSNTISIHVIDIPKKVWSPKIKSVDEGYFLFERFGKAVFRATKWEPGLRNDVIKFDPIKHNKDFESLNIDKSTLDEVKKMLLIICEAFWNCFANERVIRTILGFEFGIDTGNHTPVCCRKPVYEPYESKVIMQHLKTLLLNKWAKGIKGSSWGSSIVLAPKPHQEEKCDIDDYIWRMCVSYRGLNGVTKMFVNPINRCDSSIEDMGDHIGILFFYQSRC